MSKLAEGTRGMDLWRYRAELIVLGMLCFMAEWNASNATQRKRDIKNINKNTALCNDSDRTWRRVRSQKIRRHEKTKNLLSEVFSLFYICTGIRYVHSRLTVDDDLTK